jgi:hypothetical protein
MGPASRRLSQMTLSVPVPVGVQPGSDVRRGGHSPGSRFMARASAIASLSPQSRSPAAVVGLKSG